MSEWIVDIKGQPDKSLEISVLRSDNAHGIRSYGWFDEDKHIVASSGGPCNDKFSDFVYDGLVQLAHAYCAKLNQEANGTMNTQEEICRDCPDCLHDGECIYCNKHDLALEAQDGDCCLVNGGDAIGCDGSEWDFKGG